MKQIRGALFALCLLAGGIALPAQTLYEGFLAPPAEYSMLPFWSWNAKLEPTRIKWQIDQMKEKGVQGAFIHARAGLTESETPYFSDGFWTAMDTAVHYAASTGFHTYLYDEDKWPSGSAGGRTVATNPDEFIKKTLEYKKQTVSATQVVPLSGDSNTVAILAARIDPAGNYLFSSQLDLTEKAGTSWTVPAGDWCVVTFTLCKDPAGQIDYLDPAAVAQFIELTHENYYKRYQPFFGNTIPGIFFDEIYANGHSMQGNIFWTDRFLDTFRSIKGYELRSKLSLLLFDDPQYAREVRNDYFAVIADLYINAWFKQYADWCEQRGIWATGHTTELLGHYKRQSDYFRTMGQLQVPGADNEEYRYGFPRMIDWYNTKQISSLANIYNKERVMVEAMGGGGYVVPLEEYRYGFSMLAAYGINMFIPHLFHYDMNRPENQSDWPASWFYQNPYWKYFKPLAEYAARLSYMNAKGEEVCDVAILYPLTDLWNSGYAQGADDGLYRDLQRRLVYNHINYNVIDPHSLMKATVTNGQLSVGKGKYKVLVLPALRSVRPDVLQQITAFAEAGGLVVAVQTIPETSGRLFGFHPTDLQAKEYYQWNPDHTERYVSKMNEQNGGACFTRFLDELPAILTKRVTPGLTVHSPNAPFFRYMQRQVGQTTTFLLVNDRNLPEVYSLSVANRGIPSIWNIETGKVSPVTAYQVKGDRLELDLRFSPRESYYLVLEPNARSVAHQPTTGTASPTHDKEINTCRTITGDWQFQLVPASLDYTWAGSVETDTVSLPIMQFRPETAKSWKTVKIVDAFNSQKGVARYLSGWDGYWITPYSYSRHIPNIGGGERTFRKEISLPGTVKRANIALVADASYELRINDRPVGKGSDTGKADVYAIESYLIEGLNRIEVKTTQTQGLLLQGDIQLRNNRHIPFRSDSTWQVIGRDGEWEAAFQLTFPPLAKWGEIENPLQVVTYPAVVWYSQLIPPGAKALLKPATSGTYTVYINDKEVRFEPGATAICLSDLPQGENRITLRAEATDRNGGLQKPLQLICGKTDLPLLSWSSLGLDWYSGRALYTKEIEIAADELRPDTRLNLSLGTVCHFAEIWVNDKLVTYRPWAPFEADITDYLHTGTNKVAIVVANLLANQATWNILDDNVNNKEAVWWHSGTILREKEKLTSGMLGPVRLTTSSITTH